VSVVNKRLALRNLVHHAPFSVEHLHEAAMYQSVTSRLPRSNMLQPQAQARAGTVTCDALFLAFPAGFIAIIAGWFTA